MTSMYRDLRYLRVQVDDLDTAARFATGTFGLQRADCEDDCARFRSDARNYALCYSTGDEGDAVALSVARSEDLDAAESRLAAHAPRRLTPQQAQRRQVKAGISVVSPNGVLVEIVWRPLTSGWRYHGPRDAGITGFQAVQLACTDIAPNEAFWTEAIGAEVSDWAGDAVFLRIDDAHHRIALYPSERDGILGATWAVESVNNVMQNWYFLQACQQPIVHGPGRQPTSDAVFVTTSGPGGIHYSYAAEVAHGPQISQRGPRQFPGVALSHCAWGAPPTAPEYRGETDR
ncbi:MAG: VOC family protein [Pararhodobacter sp.]|nr:VOC family protein [Pararhodobacter sp.]